MAKWIKPKKDRFEDLPESENIEDRRGEGDGNANAARLRAAIRTAKAVTQGNSTEVAKLEVEKDESGDSVHGEDQKQYARASKRYKRDDD